MDNMLRDAKVAGRDGQGEREMIVGGLLSYLSSRSCLRDKETTAGLAQSRIIFLCPFKEWFRMLRHDQNKEFRGIKGSLTTWLRPRPLMVRMVLSLRPEPCGIPPQFNWGANTPLTGNVKTWCSCFFSFFSTLILTLYL